MNLPRSVTEMAKDDFVPRRIESCLFRGFSFTQPDFELPARNENEIESYWNSPEADGESEGSSILLEDGVSELNVTDPPMEAIPEKKKRPRRRKKKVAIVAPESEEKVDEDATSAKPSTKVASEVPPPPESSEPINKDTPLARMLKKQLDNEISSPKLKPVDPPKIKQPAWTVVSEKSPPARGPGKVAKDEWTAVKPAKSSKQSKQSSYNTKSKVSGLRTATSSACSTRTPTAKWGKEISMPTSSLNGKATPYTVPQKYSNFTNKNSNKLDMADAWPTLGGQSANDKAISSKKPLTGAWGKKI